MSERDDKLWRIDELSAKAAVALSEEGVDQESGRVSSAPSPRTIRYYTTHGLLDRPADFDGRTALYGRTHLLQLLAIKRLQARGMTLSEIQQQLLGADREELEQYAGLTSSPEETAYGEAVAQQRAFWKQATAPAEDRQDGAGRPAENSRRKAGSGRSNRTGDATERIEGVRLDEQVTLLLEGLDRPLEADDRQALEAAAAPLLRILEKRRLKSDDS